jgi:histidinol phosphatase-like enzyme (inositol monophosphatase family)
MTDGRELLEFIQSVAAATGGVALSHFRKQLAVELKADGSEVTQADREAEHVARELIRKRFPGDAIVGEELGHSPGAGGRRWIIDPIDGTSSFVRGVPLWGTLVALEQDGDVIGGAINCAATGDLVAAVRGHGCWHNESRCQVSTTSDLRRATVLTTDARFVSRPERAEHWQRLARRVAISRSWGDCYGYVLVAAGRADLMVDDRMSPWDVAALIPVIEEAGGVITDWSGRRGIGPDAIATNSALAAEFRAALGVPEAARPA